MGVQVPLPAQLKLMIKSTSKLEKQPDGTIKLQITIPWDETKKSQEEVIEKTVATTEIAGFRKGKAPRNIVEQSLDRAQIREEVLKQLLPQAYVQSVQEHGIKPIVNPKIHVEKLEDEKDWVINALTTEMPEVKLNNYKEAVKSVTAKSKIVIPGKETPEPSFDDIMKALLEHVEINVPALLLEQEVDRLLSQTLDEIKKLGLTLEQYLSSTGKTPEALREEYRKKAEIDVKAEFALQAIAEHEKLIVSDKEIDEAIQKAKDPVERKNLENNKYLLASILRQQKTLDFLKNL